MVFSLRQLLGSLVFVFVPSGSGVEALTDFAALSEQRLNAACRVWLTVNLTGFKNLLGLASIHHMNPGA